MSKRLSRRTYAVAFALVLFLFFAFEKLASPRRLDVRFLQLGETQWKGYARPARLTTVMAHQPGFTVFENLYWQNDSFYIVTDQPWTIPNVDHIAIRSTPKHDGVPTADKAVRILAIREPGINAFVREENQLGTSILLEDAVELTSSAEDLPSPLLLNYDDMFVCHYYHWIGETFLGAWRIWSHYRYRAGAVLDDFKVVSFPYMYDLDKTPKGLNYDHQWEDHAGANRFFMEKWFPGITIESRTTWEARAASNKLYRMPTVVLANRWAGHRGPSSAWKPWGDVLRMPVHPGYLLNLRQRVLKGYNGPVKLHPTRRPRVKYLTRQETNRRLTGAAHEALVEEMLKLDREGLVEFSMLHFVDGDSFPDQVAQIASTDFLIAVHGNGLTHSLWMTPGPCKAVFELQPKPCSLVGFSVVALTAERFQSLAIAAGVVHYLVTEDSMCTPLECADRGCQGHPDGVNRANIVVDPQLISHQIRHIIARHWRDGSEVE